MYVITYEKHFEGEKTPRSFVFGYYKTKDAAANMTKLLIQKSIFAPLKYGTNYQYQKIKISDVTLPDNTILYIRCHFHSFCSYYHVTVYTSDTAEYFLDYPKEGLIGGSFCDFVVLFSTPCNELTYLTRRGLVHYLARKAQHILEKQLDISITVTKVKEDPLIKETLNPF